MHAAAFSRRTLAVSAVTAAIGGRHPGGSEARQATPAPIGGDVLVETRFAAGDLPGEEAQAFFYRVTLPPGETLSHLVGPYCGCGGEQLARGAGLELVRAGSYAVRLDAPFRVIRADGSAEEIAAGAEAVLVPGDAARFPDYAAAGEIRAGGADPAVVVGLAIVSATESGTPAPDVPVAVRGEGLASMSPMTWAAVAGNGPVVVRLGRLDVPAGGDVGPYLPDGAEAILVEAGDLAVSTLRPGEAASSYPPFSYAEGKAMPFLLLGDGNTRLLANPGDAPATLLVLTVSPAGGEAATPAA